MAVGEDLSYVINDLYAQLRAAQASIVALQAGKIDKVSWTADVRNPILKTAGGNETRGNGTVTARYRVVDGWCQWQGHYVLGTTTSWPVGQISLILPVNPENATFVIAAASETGGWIRAFNGSWYPGVLEYNGGANLGTITPYTGSINGSSSVAWTTLVPFTWGSTSIMSWNLFYPTV